MVKNRVVGDIGWVVHEKNVELDDLENIWSRSWSINCGYNSAMSMS